MEEKPKNTPPWKQKRPKNTTKTPLSPELKEMARARAEAHGRRYPNLIDNMWAARQQKDGLL